MQWFFNNFVRRTHEKVLEATLTPNRRFWFGSIAIATILFSASVLQDKPPSTKVAKPGKASSSSSSSSTSSSSDSSEDPYSMNGHMCSWQWFTVVTCYNETIIWFTSSCTGRIWPPVGFPSQGPNCLMAEISQRCGEQFAHSGHCLYFLHWPINQICLLQAGDTHPQPSQEARNDQHTYKYSFNVFSDFKVDNTPKNDHAQTPAIAGAPGQPTKK